MEKFFKLKEHGTDVRTEVTAGLTTFFAMSYTSLLRKMWCQRAYALPPAHMRVI